MKKFLTSVFVLSMVLFSMNVFNSCKDYDEDEYNDLIIDINRNDATLKSKLKADSIAVAKLITALDSAQKACKRNCNARMTILHDSIVENKDSIVKIIGYIANLQAMDEILQKDIDDLYNRWIASDTGDTLDVDSVLKRIGENTTAIIKVGADLKTLSDSVYTKGLIDYKFDSLKNVYTKVSDFVKLESRVTQIADSAAYVVALAKADSIRIDNFSKVANEALERAKNDSIQIAQLKPDVQKALDLIEGLTPNVNEALERAKNDSVWIKSLEPQVQDALDKIEKLTPDVLEALERAKNDSVWVKELEPKVAALETKTQELEEAIKTAEENSKKADELLQNQIDALAQGLDDILNKKIPEIEAAYQEADQLLQDSIDALGVLVDQNAAAIDAINDDIDDIFDILDDIKDALNSLITGIVVQGTENPVYGTFALPFGINSNVLIAFYGKSDNPVVFPTKETANYVKNSQTFTNEDWAMISGVSQFRKSGNSTLFNETSGNAGTIYVTVNPGSVDFAGQTLELVNTKDVASKVVLEPLVKENDKELMFGYTRAAETNGFYSAKATLSEDDINAVKINIQDGLASAFKSVLKERTFHSVGTLASKLYQQFDGMLPAQGLKASWTDYNGEHSVYSQYGIAATAVKPLSYSFLEDLDVQTVPGYERAIKFVDRVANSVKTDLERLWPDFTALDASSIKVRKVSEVGDKYAATFTATINLEGTRYQVNKVVEGGVEYFVATHPDRGGVFKVAVGDDVKAEQDPSNPKIWYVTITKSVNDITNIVNIDGKIDDVNAFLDDVNDLLTDLDDTLGEAEGIVDKDSNKIKSYIDRLNEKLTSILNSANRRIQPVLLVGNRATGMKGASRMKGSATQFKYTTVEFILTSYTVEIVTPAFKKHIAVTNVFKNGKSAQEGDAECKAALDKANAQDKMNTVLDGDKCSVSASFDKGYVYEVAYSALDYSGKISMHKYYVGF